MKKFPVRLIAMLSCLALLFSLVACQETPSIPTEHSHSGENCVHADSDDNGTCDKCNASVLTELDFFAINDIHGKFNDSSSQPGVDELTTYLKLQGQNAVLLSSGDSWQGSSESNLTYGALMTEWMNSLGFVSMTLGNHEFDWGEEYIEANGALAQFPLLAINIYDRDTNQRVSYCDASVTLERNGITVGIIGAIGDCYTSISGDKTEGIYFLTGSELTQLVKDEATRLREAGADIIIYSLHDGYDKTSNAQFGVSSDKLRSYYDTSLSDGYVDLVFEGHSHKRYVITDEHGVYHLQAGGENSGISHAEVTCNTVTGTVSVTAEIIGSDEYSKQSADSSIQALLDKYADQISLGDKPIGKVGQYLSSDQIQQLVGELYFEAGMARWGGKYSIALAGALISIRNPYHIAAGDVKYSDIQSVLPFDNDIVLCTVPGSILRDRFFETTDERYAVYYGAYGEALRDNIDPTGTYYIITDTYTSSYAPNRLTEIDRYDTGIYARDLLADYIAQGHLAPPSAESYTLTGIPEILSTGAALDPNGTTQGIYYVQGTVIAIHSATYGNLTITDENGNELYIYGVYDSATALRYDQMDNPPKVGDTVILCGKIKNYVPNSGQAVIELADTYLIR